MRVAFIAPFGLRAKGTARARALPLAQAIACRGHETALFVPPYDGPQDSGRSWEAGGVPVINMVLPRGIVGGGLRGAAGQVRLGWRLFCAVRRWRPDVAYVFKPKGPSGLCATLSWLAGRRALVVDADDWEGPGGWNDDARAGYSAAQRRFFAWQERYGLAHARAWTVTSACLCQRAIAFGARPDRVYLLPNGLADPGLWQSLTPSRLAEPAFPSLLLYTRFAGVLVDDVVAIWRRVRAARPDAVLTVVGQGLGGEEFGLASEPGVKLVGWIEPREMPAVFASQSLAVVPWQDTPANRARHSAKVLELMAAGLPVVATGVGELPSTLGDAGVLVPPAQPPALAQAVIDLLDDGERRARLGQAARQRVFARYTWQHLAGVALEALTAAQGVWA